MLLKYLLENAANYLGISKINKIVVTIPAYFSKPQIAAMMSSCEKASVETIRTIKESQAIALGIYHDNKVKEDKNVLIINMGGSALDVATITIQEKLFEVKSMHGDTTLGGQDFVQRLIDYCIHEFGEKEKQLIIDNKSAYELIRVQCEVAKRLLTHQSSAKIICPKLHKGLDLNVTITRQKYEQLCEDLVQRCVAPIVVAMKDANLNV